MDESERLIAIAALAPPERAVGAWDQWRATVPIDTASTLLTWAAGYIHRNLLAAGVDDPYLRGIYRHNLLSNSAHVVAALGAIRDLGSRWLITPLKSFGMTGETYSRGLRPLADFDFYVPAREALAVKSRLEGLGFGALMNVSQEEFTSRIMRQRGSWNFKNAAGVDLDLHWRLLEHLGTTASEELVAMNSTVVESEFGTIRRLDDELLLISIAVHYQLLGTSLMSGVFDFSHLLKHVDVEKAARLAVATGSVREITELCDELGRIVGPVSHHHLNSFRSALDRVAASSSPHGATRVVGRFFERLPRRYFETELHRSPTAYRAWFALARRPAIERLLLRILGPFSRSSANPQDRDELAVSPFEGGALGIGWHYRYLNDPFRWANIPDARIVFRGVGRVRGVRVVLEPGIWQLTPTESFGVFCNGYLVGYCDNSASTFEFALPEKAVSEIIELSLRLTSRRRFVDPGIHIKWFRMLAPVVRVELLSEH